jgi:hypothetical protein
MGSDAGTKQIGADWQNATTEYEVAHLIKRVPEWAMYK